MHDIVICEHCYSVCLHIHRARSPWKSEMISSERKVLSVEIRREVLQYGIVSHTELFRI